MNIATRSTTTSSTAVNPALLAVLWFGIQLAWGAVLGTAYGIASGVVVDTHVQRLSQRLDLTKSDEPKKIEQDLMAVIPKERWILFSHQLIWHGRRVCAARKPKCVECNLERLCYSKDKTI